ncbi:amidase [Parapusillimonas sp. SGNA-6]|nr:amidase [Parapusillimonas sp. SGNA-6]
MLPTLLQLQQDLASGKTTSAKLTEDALSRIADQDGEGAKTFTEVWPEQARAAARASDTLRAAGMGRSLIEGLPLSIKDLFDVAGRTTLAGSVVLKGAAPARRNATIVTRLLAAGAILVGRTNMTEFAFSGLGLNPHYGTPRNPWDRGTGRIPGGSSSGAAISVTDRMSVAAIGTDTGGSVRIPSALCGLTGFKPTASRVPLDGSLPLATSLDSIGPLAASVTCCAVLDAILSGSDYRPAVAPPLGNLRFATTSTVVLDGADDHVRSSFHEAVEAIRGTGAHVEEIDIPEFAEMGHINRQGGLNCAEAYSVHRQMLAQAPDDFDPRVASRILRGRDIGAADYIELLQTRERWKAGVAARLAYYDALLLPTVPVVAPTIASLEASDEDYFVANGLMLRNPGLINFLDGCALSLPCHADGTAPVGLMVAGIANTDQRILDVGLALEQLLASNRGVSL